MTASLALRRGIDGGFPQMIFSHEAIIVPNVYSSFSQGERQGKCADHNGRDERHAWQSLSQVRPTLGIIVLKLLQGTYWQHWKRRVTIWLHYMETGKRFPHYCPVIRGLRRLPLGSPHQEPVMWSFGVYVVDNLNKILDNQSSYRWFEKTAIALIWCHSDGCS